MTRYVVPPLRRCVQAMSVGLLVLLPILSLYTHYKSARALEDLQGWRAGVLKGIDRFVGDSKQRQAWVDHTQGTFWSARVLGVSLSDPLAGAEAIGSSKTLYAPLLWSLLIPAWVALLLGRVFCGWVCPMNTLLEVVDRCRRLLRLAELGERDVKFSLRNKYVMLAVGLAVVMVTGTPFLALVYPPAVLSREVHQFVFGVGVGTGVFFVLAVCAFELFVSKRWWCRYVCPGGALYSLLGRCRVVRVKRDSQKCISCGDCVRVCQFAQRPMLVETTGMECTNCAACISSCNSNALRYGIVLPIIQAKPSRRAGPPLDRAPAGSASSDRGNRQNQSASAARRSQLTKSAFLVTALLLLVPAVARAHHILGLPHYSYKENYPQAPTLEYPATTGPYDVLMTSYPGKPVPGEAATVAFYIKHRRSGRPFDQPVAVRVVQTYTFGSNREILPRTVREPFDHQHKYIVTFPEDGEYVVELTINVEGRPEVISFVMVAGQPTATVSSLIGIGVALAVFLLAVRAIKKKRNRRQSGDAGRTGRKALVAAHATEAER